MKKWIINNVKLRLCMVVLSFPFNAFANPQNTLSLPSALQFNGESSFIVEYQMPKLQDSISAEAKQALIKSVDKQFKATLSKKLSAKIGESFSFVPGAVASLDQNELNQIKQNPFIKSVYQNRIRRINLGQSRNLVLPGASKSRHSGKGQTIAILDTGVDTGHSFFKTDGVSRVVSEACFTRGGFLREFREIFSLCPNRSRVEMGTGAGVDCTRLGIDGCDHGTHVAGIAAGNDGVANQANLMVIQVFTGLRDIFRRNICGTGFGDSCIVAFDSDIVFALEHVYAARASFNIAAVNLSLGGGLFNGSCNFEVPAMTDIINRLREAGIATVIASGNDGASSAVSHPGCISSAITVGATSDFTGVIGSNSNLAVFKDERVFYSNNSSIIDLYAPGTLIRSSVPGNGFANFNGTSMAAPHVAGAFAVVKAANQELTSDEIEAVFKSVGPTISHNGIDRSRVNVSRALQQFGLFTPSVPMWIIMTLLEDQQTNEDAAP